MKVRKHVLVIAMIVQGHRPVKRPLMWVYRLQPVEEALIAMWEINIVEVESVLTRTSMTSSDV